MNLQRITAHEWSLYVLKYATKANGPVDVTIDGSSAERLGLEVASPDMLSLLSSMVTAKIVSPCDVAIQMAGISILQFSDAVKLQDLTFTEYFTRYELRDDAMQGPQSELLSAANSSNSYYY
ncbi:helitron_like_N domain-containing protein, partial [Haematococcus lacustris]